MNNIKKAWKNYLDWRQKNYEASGMREEAISSTGISREDLLALLPIMGGIKLFRGMPKWFKGTTVVNDKVVGGGGRHWTGQKMPKENVYATTSEKIADSFAGKKGIKFKFDVPEKYIKKYAESESSYLYPGEVKYAFKKGLPTKFIEKIYGMNSKK